MNKISDIVKKFLKQHKCAIILYSILLLSFPIATVALPHYYGKIMENISDKEFVGKNVQIVAILWCIVLLLNLGANYLDAYFKPKLKSFVRKNVIINILEQFKESYKEQEVGNLISKIIKLPSTINDIVHQVRNYIIPTLLIFLFAIGYFFYINPQLGIVTFIGLAIFIIITCIFMNSCIDHAKDMDNTSDKLYEEVGDVLENLANIYTSSTCEEELERLEQYQKKLEEKYSDTIKCSAKFNLLFSFAYLLLFFGINYYSYTLYLKKKIKLSQFLSIIIVSLYIMAHLKNATIEIRDFIFNIGIVNKTQTFLDQLFLMGKQTKSGNKSINIQNGSINVENVYLKYPGSSSYIFENLNLSIPGKQSVAIMGQIGSGKTSFIKMLLKLNKYQKGKVYIDNQDITDVDPDELRRKITYIPQHPIPFNRTLYENISYGTKVSKEIVYNTIRQLGLDILFNPLTLDSNVGKHGEKLSGGQKQVVFLLKCLFKDTNIIILDEPTSALDEVNKKHILNMLQEIIKNKTVLIITHDQEVLKYVDRKIVFKDGKIIL